MSVTSEYTYSEKSCFLVLVTKVVCSIVKVNMLLEEHVVMMNNVISLKEINLSGLTGLVTYTTAGAAVIHSTKTSLIDLIY